MNEVSDYTGTYIDLLIDESSQSGWMVDTLYEMKSYLFKRNIMIGIITIIVITCIINTIGVIYSGQNLN